MLISKIRTPEEQAAYLAELLTEAGFARVELLYQSEGTALLRAVKEQGGTPAHIVGEREGSLSLSFYLPPLRAAEGRAAFPTIRCSEINLVTQSSATSNGKSQCAPLHSYLRFQNQPADTL